MFTKTRRSTQQEKWLSCRKYEPEANEAYTRSYLPEPRVAMETTVIAQLSKLLRIPPIFWASVADQASGFFGCQEKQGEKNELLSFGKCFAIVNRVNKWIDSYFRFLIKEPLKPILQFENCSHISAPYIWHKIGLYVAWTPSQGIIILCRGMTPALENSLSDALKTADMTNILNDPFGFHVILLEKLTAFYDSVLWSWRDLVRDLEKARIYSMFELHTLLIL